jgi:DNA end-binding protein Ku
MAKSLIEQYTSEFDFEKYKDVYNDQLLKIIKAKTGGKKTKTEKFESKATPATDLMAQLKASLDKKKKKSKAS